MVGGANVATKITNCPNPENAEKFIDFLTSVDAQEALASVLNRPLRTGVELPEGMIPLEEMEYFYWDVKDVEAKKTGHY